MKNWTRGDSLGLLGVVALLLVIYLPGLDAGYYSDDFQFYFDGEGEAAWRAFVRPNDGNNFYRPIEAISLGWIQSRWGLDPRPVHAAVLVLHLGTCLIVGLAGRRLGLGPAGAWSAAAIMGGSQAAVHAVQSLDTLSQVGATFFALLAIAVVAVPVAKRASSPGPWRWTGALGALAMALFCKESGISALPAQVLLLAWAGRGDRALRRGPILTIVGLVGVVAAYLAVRSAVVGAGPAMGSGRYDFHTGLNIPRNMALLGFSAVLPFSSVRLFLDVQTGRWVPVAVALTGAVCVTLLLFIGWRRGGRRSLRVWLAILGATAMFPMAALNHVSELYTYNLLPFVGLLVGLATDGLLERSGPRQRLLLGVVLLGILATHCEAARHKSGLMEMRGAEASRLLTDLRAHVETAPPGAAFRIVEAPRPPGPSYSVFLMPPLDLLREGPRGLARAVGRSDLILRFGPSGSNHAPGGEVAAGNAAVETVLVIQDGRLAPIEEAEEGGTPQSVP